MSTDINISVLAGQKRVEVGTVPVKAGMLTNLGKVQKVTPSGTVFIETTEGKVTRTRVLDKLKVRLTEARKCGYPDADGCQQFKEVLVRQRKQLVSI